MRNNRGKIDGKPNPVDIHVGQRLRAIRMSSGMSQEKLAEAMAMTFQQIQKYEKGNNRVGASRLFDIATLFGVPVQYFFEDMPAAIAAQRPSIAMIAVYSAPAPARRRDLELIRNVHALPDNLQSAVYGLAKALAEYKGVA